MSLVHSTIRFSTSFSGNRGFTKILGGPPRISYNKLLDDCFEELIVALFWDYGGRTILAYLVLI